MKKTGYALKLHSSTSALFHHQNNATPDDVPYWTYYHMCSERLFLSLSLLLPLSILLSLSFSVIITGRLLSLTLRKGKNVDFDISLTILSYIKTVNVW